MRSAQGGADRTDAVGQRSWQRLSSIAARELGARSLIEGALNRGVRERPALRALVSAELLRWSASAHQQQLFAALKPHVASMITSDVTARDERFALREVLWKLDQVDAVAEYLELPAPFGVRQSLAGAVDVSASAVSTEATQRVGYRVHPPPGKHEGRMIFLAGENPAAGGALIGFMGEAAMNQNEKSLADYVPCDALLLQMPTPGAGGVRLHFRLVSFPAQSALHILGPDGSLDLKLRRPQLLKAGLDARIWLTATLTGAPARAGGPWSLRHARAFQDSGRAYYLLDEVWVEPVP